MTALFQYFSSEDPEFACVPCRLAISPARLKVGLQGHWPPMDVGMPSHNTECAAQPSLPLELLLPQSDAASAMRMSGQGFSEH